MIRKIKNKEKLNSMKFCNFCKPQRVDAIYRNGNLQFACELHKHKLGNDNDDCNSEADYIIDSILNRSCNL